MTLLFTLLVAPLAQCPGAYQLLDDRRVSVAGDRREIQRRHERLDAGQLIDEGTGGIRGQAVGHDGRLRLHAAELDLHDRRLLERLDPRYRHLAQLLAPRLDGVGAAVTPMEFEAPRQSS